jgi:transcriptional regulator with XRE-family HTH domain
MTTTTNEIGVRIVTLRKRLGLNQTAFSDRLNADVPGLRTTQQAVWRWEAGKVIPRDMVMLALARMESTPDSNAS